MSLHCVFAYGSNMDRGDYLAWCKRRGKPPGEWSRVEVAALPGHRLTFDYRSVSRSGGAANVTAEPSGTVYGLALWVDAIALATLDAKEGHPRIYERQQMTLEVEASGPTESWVYVVRPEHREAEHVPPTRYYHGLILSAAQRHAFPAKYIQELGAVVTAPD